MSIFGDLDAETVVSNAYYIAKGDYTAQVTKAFFKDREDGRQLIIEYTIDGGSDGVETEYVDSKATQYFNLVDKGMNAEKLSMLPAEEQKKIRQTNAKIKRTLCGNPSNTSQKGLGVSASDLNDPDWKPEVLVGTKVNMGISNYGTDGVNVNWVNIIQN
jgi:hypothetical protein